MSETLADPERENLNAEWERQAEELLKRVADRVTAASLPVATYRFQFHKDFTFANAADLVPYLHDLGISHIYASPYLKARAGSTHGYDIVDPTQLNPEIGPESDYERMTTALHERGMGHLLDVVPNHMGVGSDENPWWQDVLENGPSSPYAVFFDIDWRPLKSDLQHKVLLPVLGAQYGAALEAGELQLHFGDGAFRLECYGRKYPLAPRSFATILRHRLDELQSRLTDDAASFEEFQSILTAISHLPRPYDSDPKRVEERLREKEVIKRRLHRLSEDCATVRQFIAENLEYFNGRQGEAASFDPLDALLQEQSYRLAYWRAAGDEVNYRRFFDVNELAAVSMERPDVFAKTHEFVFRLLDEGKVDGLRIDHADGLYAPTEYLWQLQKARCLQLCRREFEAEEHPGVTWEELSPVVDAKFDSRRRDGWNGPEMRPLYLVVEKILEGKETLPADWPVNGTTGYEFLNEVNWLFVDRAGEKAFDQCYAKFIGEHIDFEDLIYRSKRLIMNVSMAGEMHALGYKLDRISEQHRHSRDFTLSGLTHSLRDLVACFPVYRCYTTPGGVLGRDKKYIEQAVARARQRSPYVGGAEFDFIRDLLMLKLPAADDPKSHAGSGYDHEAVLRFIGRLQQFTGPVTAKAVEDTAYYNYHRLISLNEVGGDPRQFGADVDGFHQFNVRKLQSHPRALSATETHDAKRGEDTRVRIDVLSELPKRWKENVTRWARWNKRKKVTVAGKPAPSRNDEYLIYQTLIGTWPFESPTGDALAAYVDRLSQYMTKALREGKVSSSWISPNEAYEQAIREFLTAILVDDPPSAFRTDFEPLAREVAWCGILNSLGQQLLKVTAPGVPDIYQGTELWDFSLVDPDNRRPVDYGLRQRGLQEIQERTQRDRAGFVSELIQAPHDGRIKMFVLLEALEQRRRRSELFTTGEYLPLTIRGANAEHLCAFARRAGEQIAVVVIPRLLYKRGIRPENLPLGTDWWSGTEIALPMEMRNREWRHAFTGELLHSDRQAVLSAAETLQRFPVALLMHDPHETHSH